MVSKARRLIAKRGKSQVDISSTRDNIPEKVAQFSQALPSRLTVHLIVGSLVTQSPSSELKPVLMPSMVGISSCSVLRIERVAFSACSIFARSEGSCTA